jgi:hypothetical protein
MQRKECSYQKRRCVRVAAENPKENLVKQDVGLPTDKVDVGAETNGVVRNRSNMYLYKLPSSR